MLLERSFWDWRSKRYRLRRLVMFGLFGLPFALTSRAEATQGTLPTVQAQNKQQILRLVGLYVQSIDAADPTLGATVWDTSPEVTLIEPRGQERGWAEIVNVFYRKTMGAVFSNRTLTVQEPIAVHLYGDAAVVEFTWSFVGLVRDDGETIHTFGRESQAYINLPDRGWRLVHVHYSGPALKETGKGF